MTSVSEEKFYNVFQKIFMGAKIKGISGFINLMQVKSRYYEDVFKDIEKGIKKELKADSPFKEEFYDKLFGFFDRYFNETGSIFFTSTPFREKIFEQVYTDSDDVSLFWKSHMLYYVKTDIVPKNMEVTLNEFNFIFSVSNLKHKGTWEKKNFVFKFDSADFKTKEIKIDVTYSKNGSKTKIKEIKKSLKTEKILVDEELLDRAFKIFEMQIKIDYFINKDPKKFLNEQLRLYLYRYVFDEKTLTSNRLKQIQFLKESATKIINFISQFEVEIGKIWIKPKFAFDVNYVITLDKFESKINVLKALTKDKNWKNQLKDWENLEFISKGEKPKIIKNAKINPEFKFLPLDTKFFTHKKLDILTIFESIDDEIDGYLIQSENFQALKTILPKFKEQIKTIYADPPFNKENEADYFYSVKFKDATWITMLENRIKVAREFLKKDGSMFVRCDYNGNMYVRLLLNEIFKPTNFRNEIVVSRSNEVGTGQKKYGVATDSLFYYSKINDLTATDSLYYYSKSDAYYFSKFQRPRLDNESSGTNYVFGGVRPPRERVFNIDSDTYILLPPPDKHFKFGVSLHEEKNKVKGFFEFANARNGLQSGWRRYIPNKDLKNSEINVVTDYPLKFKEQGLIYFSKSELKDSGLYENIGTEEKPKWNQIKGKWQPFDKSPKYDFDTDKNVNSNWTDISGYAAKWDFPTENSELVLERVIKTSSKEKDFVMDFFLGSGTTIATAHKLGRRWVGIEMGAHFNTHVFLRMKKVLHGEQSGISKNRDIKWKGGGCFKYYDLEQYEQTLQKISYKDEDPLFIGTEEKYNQYIFMKDEKMLKGLDIDYEKNKINVKLENIYPTIDIGETLSNLTGKMIKSINDDEIIFNDDTKITLSELDYKLIKPLIWW